MGNRYIVKQEGVTPTAGNDILTIISAANRRFRLIEVSVAGRGTSSAMQQLDIGRSTAGTTGGGAQTPDKFDHNDEPAAVSTYNTTWSVQPTLGAQTEVLGWNALGGANRWVPPKGWGYECRNGDQLSIRAASGVTFQPMSVSVIVEED